MKEKQTLETLEKRMLDEFTGLLLGEEGCSTLNNNPPTSLTMETLQEALALIPENPFDTVIRELGGNPPADGLKVPLYYKAHFERTNAVVPEYVTYHLSGDGIYIYKRFPKIEVKSNTYDTMKFMNIPLLREPVSSVLKIWS